jgi:uncharacterized protein (UPF0335 family)
MGGGPLEGNVEHDEHMELVERITRVEEKVQGINDRIEPMARDIHTVSNAVKGRAGFMAGVVATVSFVWAALLAAAHFFFDK